MTSLLEVDELTTAFETEKEIVTVIDRISFNLGAGETLGIVGESGCGKSVTALSIMGLLPKPTGRITAGDIRFKNESLLNLPAERLRDIRGNRIAMIFQEPMTALNPVHRIGQQLAEPYTLHQPELTSTEIRKRCIALLERVGIPAPDQRIDEYPHQLSGGMRQRVIIAMALASQPDILIADEPTTALDVTIQAQILELLVELQGDYGMSILFITHDLGVIAEMCSRVLVMYAGRVAEHADITPLFQRPLHPYTQGLLTSIPRLENKPKSTLTTIPGVVPSLYEMPSGCRFGNRCPYVDQTCRRQEPVLIEPERGRKVACHHWSGIENAISTKASS